MKKFSQNGYEYDLGFEVLDERKKIVDLSDEIISMKIRTNDLSPLEIIDAFTSKFKSEDELRDYLLGLGYNIPNVKLGVYQSRSGYDNNLPYDIMYKSGKRFLDEDVLRKRFSSMSENIAFYIQLSKYLTRLVRQEHGDYYGIETDAAYFEGICYNLTHRISTPRDCLGYYHSHLSEMQKRAYRVLFNNLLGQKKSYNRLHEIVCLYDRVTSDEQKELTDITENDPKLVTDFKAKYKRSGLTSIIGLGYYMRYGYAHLFEKESVLIGCFYDSSYDKYDVFKKNR